MARNGSRYFITEADEFYDRVRKRIVDEDNVINHRMMWGTLAQTALFAGFGFVRIDAIKGIGLAVPLAIAFVGLCTAVLTLVSIVAAQWEIDALKRLYDDHAKSKTGYSSILPILSSPQNHQLGHMLPLYMPGLLIALWLLAAGVVAIK